MSEWCEKCQRVLVTDHRDPNWLAGCRDIAGIGDEMDAMLCEVAAESYRRGLREGVDIVRIADRGVPIDWASVDAELERRTK